MRKLESQAYNVSHPPVHYKEYNNLVRDSEKPMARLNEVFISLSTKP